MNFLLQIISLVSNLRATKSCTPSSLSVLNIYNEFSGGYVRVMGKKVIANESDKGEYTFLLSILILSFYIFLSLLKTVMIIMPLEVENDFFL